jgi:hypothetical protein
MATLATSFKGALSNIEPRGDATNAKDAHEQASETLGSDSWLTDLGVNPVLIGSYARDVSTRRVKTSMYSPDWRRPTPLFGPGECSTAWRRSLTTSSPSGWSASTAPSRLTSRTTTCRSTSSPHGEHWEIPEKIKDDGNATWVETNPTKMTELKEEANKEFLLYDDNPTSALTGPRLLVHPL